MKYLLENKDFVSKIFVRYQDINDFSSFSIEIYVHAQEARIKLHNIINPISEVFLIPGFLKAYRRLRSTIKSDSPIDRYLDNFEDALEPDEKLILEVADE